MKNRLKELRKKLGLKQRDIADKLEVSLGLVGQWESGIQDVSKSHRAALCRAFNVRREWLENGTGEMFEPGKSLDDQLCGIAKELFSKLDAKGQEAVVKVLEQIVESLGGEVKKPKDNRPAWEIINERNGRSQINLGTVNGDWRQD